MHRSLAFAVLIPLGLSACSGGGGGAGGGGNFCDVVKSFDELQNELENPDIDPSASPEAALDAMKDSFQTLRERVEDMRDAAPEEIEGAVGELADAATEFIDLFLDADSLEDLADPEIGERISALTGDLEDAQNEVRDYTKAECGIDLGDDDSGDGAEE